MKDTARKKSAAALLTLVRVKLNYQSDYLRFPRNVMKGNKFFFSDRFKSQGKTEKSWIDRMQNQFLFCPEAFITD